MSSASEPSVMSSFATPNPESGHITPECVRNQDPSLLIKQVLANHRVGLPDALSDGVSAVFVCSAKTPAGEARDEHPASGRALRPADVGEESRVYRRGGHDPCARHRRQHGDIQCDECGPAAFSPRAEPRAAGISAFQEPAPGDFAGRAWRISSLGAHLLRPPYA